MFDGDENTDVDLGETEVVTDTSVQLGKKVSSLERWCTK